MSYLPGGTAAGVAVKDGVILAADRRVSYGFYLMSKAGRKVFEVTDRIGVVSWGFLSDMQVLARRIGVEMRLYELETGRKPRVRNAAKLLSLILFGRRVLPYLVEIMVGGVDDTGSHLYVLDPVGALIEDDFMAVGTGGQMAISVLEEGYRKEMDVASAEELVIKAMKSAFSRDAVSGDGIDLLAITGKGIERKFIEVREVAVEQ